MNMQVTGLVIETSGRRHEVRAIRDRFLVIDRANGIQVFRSEPCPPETPARDEWLWGCAEAIVPLLMGDAFDPEGDEVGLLHDWLADLDIPGAVGDGRS